MSRMPGGTPSERRLRRSTFIGRSGPARAATSSYGPRWRLRRPDAPARFFENYGDLLRPFRRYFRLQHVLWGLTAVSPYSRGASARGIDPFAARSMRYLVVYPFAKTHDWYQTPADERRAMMSDHIRVGREYPSTDQLLLYSTGLQDHEFVVL